MHQICLDFSFYIFWNRLYLYIYIYIRMVSYLIFFDETHERSPLYLDRLSVSIVKSDHEMEEVTFSQITRWLFFEVCPADADPEI